MSDFNFVTNRLATGAAITDDSLKDLMAAGITHVVDCAEELVGQDAARIATKLIYLPNGTADDGTPKPVEWFKPAIEFALAALGRSHNKVYIHCAAGVNRGPSVTMAVLMAWGISPSDAEYMIRRVRPQVGLAYKTDAINAVNKLGYT